MWSLKRELRTPTHTLFLKMKMILSRPCLVCVCQYLFLCGDLGMCDPPLFVFHTTTVCLFLGIVFLPNAALYWLCEFLRRNRPNSGREFRSLREIMGQSKEIYGAHIENKIRREKSIKNGPTCSSSHLLICSSAQSYAHLLICSSGYLLICSSLHQMNR